MYFYAACHEKVLDWNCLSKYRLQDEGISLVMAASRQQAFNKKYSKMHTQNEELNKFKE